MKRGGVTKVSFDLVPVHVIIMPLIPCSAVVYSSYIDQPPLLLPLPFVYCI
jgi:hypothetical protein